MGEDLGKHIFGVISRVLGIPVDAIDETSSPDTIEAWGSLKHMDIVLSIEEDLGIRFSDDQIVDMMTVGEIVQTVNEIIQNE